MPAAPRQLPKATCWTLLKNLAACWRCCPIEVARLRLIRTYIHRRDVAARRLFVAAVELRGGGRRHRLFARPTPTRLHFQTQRQQSLVEVCGFENFRSAVKADSQDCVRHPLGSF